jgi:hypothetical protein
MSTPLSQIFTLLGKLDDSPGEESARERFRRFIRENIREVGTIRDYVEECLRTAGDQYDRALQDFVTYTGHFLGFEVAFGRYRGVHGQSGFDGFWKSPADFHVVVEVKTTEVYPIKSSILVGYVDELISEKKITDWGKAIGLYVVGRPDKEIRQLENAIIAEKRTHQLRVISAESLLSLAEMMDDYDISHEDILAVIRPSGPIVDPVVDLMARLVAEPIREKALEEEPAPTKGPGGSEVAYWLTPVKSDDKGTAEEVIRTLVGEEKVYAFGERTPGRKRIKPGDRICFYATAIGVVAHAEVASAPEKKTHPRLRHPERYPWMFRLNKVILHLKKPTVIDVSTRSRLDAFRGRDPNRPWAWFVQGTRSISGHDFDVLIQGQVGSST